MTSCEHYEQLLSAMVDDAVDQGAERLAAVDHVVECESCREFWRQSRSLDALMELTGVATGKTPAPISVGERLEAALGPRPSTRVPAWALQLAATVVLLLGVVVVLRQGVPTPLESSPVPAPVAVATEVAVQLDSDDGAMTEARFVQITTELLQADTRYHRAMLEIMEDVAEVYRDDVTSDDLAETEPGPRQSGGRV